MDAIDHDILARLVEDGRASYAEIARALGISRASVRERVQRLREQGVIENFTVVVNPEYLDKRISAFLDVQATPAWLPQLAEELAACDEVASLYVMSDMTSLHVHVLTADMPALERFTQARLFAREGVLRVECKLLLSRIKHRRGGARL
ncbi:Lrp/AsnC family transcriptional regulator [Acidihalobacter prosperus]|uniref:AsnC family transcriptional regulator n=1 Tax=Acidihalobacter prosperus TaxID=160660 RepID=A0A1A6C504_9GAMM|nr:Lrp/AsnC family transcriptional regulator [Acidihalobacter prosperus]OBS09651.1 AsnC family transcriptional regulator [Acidihalobacter prosperus]